MNDELDEKAFKVAAWIIGVSTLVFVGLGTWGFIELINWVTSK